MHGKKRERERVRESIGNLKYNQIKRASRVWYFGASEMPVRYFNIIIITQTIFAGTKRVQPLRAVVRLGTVLPRSPRYDDD